MKGEGGEIRGQEGKQMAGRNGIASGRLVVKQFAKSCLVVKQFAYRGIAVKRYAKRGLAVRQFVNCYLKRRGANS